MGHSCAKKELVPFYTFFVLTIAQLRRNIRKTIKSCNGKNASWTAAGSAAPRRFRAPGRFHQSGKFSPSESGVSPIPRQPPHSKTLRAAQKWSAICHQLDPRDFSRTP
jgi:hypothetical protein